jgi:hypothetical protein
MRNYRPFTCVCWRQVSYRTQYHGATWSIYHRECYLLKCNVICIFSHWEERKWRKSQESDVAVLVGTETLCKCFSFQNDFIRRPVNPHDFMPIKRKCYISENLRITTQLLDWRSSWQGVEMNTSDRQNLHSTLNGIPSDFTYFNGPRNSIMEFLKKFSHFAKPIHDFVNLEVHQSVKKNLSLDPTLDQLNPLRTLTRISWRPSITIYT